MNNGNWTSERIERFAGNILKKLAEKKLNFNLELDKSILLMKYRTLGDNLKTIHKKQQIKLKDSYGNLKKEYKDEIIFQEMIQNISGKPKADIRKEIIDKANKEKRKVYSEKQKGRKIQKKYNEYFIQYTKFEKFIYDVINLYIDRVNVLITKLDTEKDLAESKKELTDLFCKGINEAIKHCMSKY